MAKSETNTNSVWMRIIALACAVCLLLLAVLSCAGCGEKKKDAEQEGEQVQEAQQPEDMMNGEGAGDQETADTEGGQAGPGDKAGNATRPDGEAETVPDGGEIWEEEGIPGGSTEFSLESQQIGDGMIRSGLKVTDISWSDQGEYFRIVFEFKLSDGGDVVEVPNCFSWYKESESPGEEYYYELFISLDDITSGEFDYAPFTAGDAPVSLGDPLVETMERVGAEDMDPVAFLVRCAHSDAHPGTSSRPHRLTYETGPMRVYLDIQKL